MEASNSTDEQLLSDLAAPGNFEELYGRHVGKVTAFATRRCCTADEVPDLVAAVWLEVIASADAFDLKRGLALPWIFGVAANLTASNERRRARELDALQRLGHRPLLDTETLTDLEARIDSVGPARDALRQLRQLPKAERLIAELVLVEGLRPQHAAKALGISAGTARMRLLRARQKLRRSLPHSLHPVSDPTFPISEA